MKIYLLNVKVYNYKETVAEDEYIEVFSNFERAKEYGLNFIKRQLDFYCRNKSITQSIKDENVDFDFRIIEEDIEYAEKFDKKLEFHEEIEGYLKYEPTHKEYVLDHTGKITDIILEYLPNQQEVRGYNHLYMKPNDLNENAGKKFKIGDIVKIVKYNTMQNNEITYQYYPEYSDLYVIRYLPRRTEGQKYLRNTYALSEIKDEDYAPGIYTKEFHEEQIEKYEGVIEKNSPIDVLRKIYTNEIEIDYETWKKLKNGIISFRDKDKNENKYYKKVLNVE